MNFDPWKCTACGSMETELQRELDKDCPCGGSFAPVPYQFKERPATKSSTHILTAVPGNIACQGCGCRDTRKPGCECICHATAVSGKVVKSDLKED